MYSVHEINQFNKQITTRNFRWRTELHIDLFCDGEVVSFQAYRIEKSSTNRQTRKRSSFTILMWHFGADSVTEYSGYVSEFVGSVLRHIKSAWRQWESYNWQYFNSEIISSRSRQQSVNDEFCVWVVDHIIQKHQTKKAVIISNMTNLTVDRS